MNLTDKHRDFKTQRKSGGRKGELMNLTFIRRNVRTWSVSLNRTHVGARTRVEDDGSYYTHVSRNVAPPFLQKLFLLTRTGLCNEKSFSEPDPICHRFLTYFPSNFVSSTNTEDWMSTAGPGVSVEDRLEALEVMCPIVESRHTLPTRLTSSSKAMYTFQEV